LRLLGLALRRLAASLPALAMIIVGLFLLLQFAPGDTVDALVAQIGGGDAAITQELRHFYGLDVPVPVFADRGGPEAAAASATTSHRDRHRDGDRLPQQDLRGPQLFRRSGRRVVAMADVSLTLPRGATLGIVGESGSGKSTLARCLVRLLEPDCGSMRLGALDFTALRGRALRRERRRVQMIFQDPFASLNPRRRAGELVAQGLLLQGFTHRDAQAGARELFGLVGLDAGAIDRYPHEFSGGQRQRIGIARALALKPEVLVADEPVSALDVVIQAQVLALLVGLQARLGLSMIFITHDLRVAAQVCDRIAVMKDGRVVERGETAALFAAPAHPYTAALLAAVPGTRGQPTGTR